MEEIGLGILIGFGIAALRKKYRPAVKSAIKLGLTAGEALKDAIYEHGERLADMVAEARQEVEARRTAEETAAARSEKAKPDDSN